MTVGRSSRIKDARELAGAGVWLLAAVVAVVGIAAQIARPLAPDLGPAPPPDAFFDAAYLERMAAFRRPLPALSVTAVLVRLAVAAAAAFSPPGRRAAARVAFRFGRRPGLAAAAIVTATVVVIDLAILPLAFWAGFLHERAYGLRTGGPEVWFYDWIVANGPVWLGVAVLTAGGYWLASRLPRTWPAVGGVVAGVLGGVLAFVAPLVLEPLEFRLEPLGPGPARDAVEEVVARSGRAADAILVADASRRTTRENAYVSGLGGTRRIVLYDTLLEGRSPREVALVLAHELGHEQHADLLRSVLLGATGTVTAASVLALVARRRTARGLQDGPTDPRGAPVILFTAIVLVLLSLPIQSAVSRRAEAAADLASLNLTQDPETFAAAQQGLTRTNLTHPRPPDWIRIIWSSHPPPSARLEMARRWPFGSGP